MARVTELYEKAVELGLEKFFPRTELFCCLGNVPIIIQEKVDFSDCNIPSEKFHEIERIARLEFHDKLCSKIMNYLRENADFRVRNISSRWLSACVRLYGKKTVFELEKFIIDNRIKGRLCEFVNLNTLFHVATPPFNGPHHTILKTSNGAHTKSYRKSINSHEHW